MRSWNLDSFVKEFGSASAVDLWGVSHQAVSAAIRKKRDIRVVCIDGFYEVRESKILKKVSVDSVSL